VATEPQKHILLAEDNPGDVQLLQYAVLTYGRLSWCIYRVADGEAALAFLRQEGVYAGMPRLDLVLLDIGLPKLNGWEVLRLLRTLPTLATLPVVMLTGVLTPQDEAQCVDLRPQACLVKPMQIEDYQPLVEAIEQQLGMIPRSR